MAHIVIRGRLLKWGNTYGIRLTKAQVEHAGLKPGADVEVRLETTGPIDLSTLHTFRDDPEVGLRHDEILGEALLEELDQRQKRRKRARR